MVTLGAVFKSQLRVPQSLESIGEYTKTCIVQALTPQTLQGIFESAFEDVIWHKLLQLKLMWYTRANYIERQKAQAREYLCYLISSENVLPAIWHKQAPKLTNNKTSIQKLHIMKKNNTPQLDIIQKKQTERAQISFRTDC